MWWKSRLDLSWVTARSCFGTAEVEFSVNFNQMLIQEVSVKGKEACGRDTISCCIKRATRFDSVLEFDLGLHFGWDLTICVTAQRCGLRIRGKICNHRSALGLKKKDWV